MQRKGGRGAASKRYKDRHKDRPTERQAKTHRMTDGRQTHRNSLYTDKYAERQTGIMPNNYPALYSRHIGTLGKSFTYSCL